MKKPDEKKIFEELNVFFKEKEFNLISLELIAEGTQSFIYLVTAEDGMHIEKYVLKKFKSSYASNTEASIRNEYDILSIFNSYISKNHPDSVTTPKPIYLFTNNHSYLMEYKEGGILRKNIPTSRKDCYNTIVNILTGLNAFHLATGHIYGDFHAENILISKGNTIVFLDVTTPVKFHCNEEFLTLKHPLEAMDIGYFTYSTCVNFHKNLRSNPLSAIQLILFTKQLIRESMVISVNGDYQFLKSLRVVCFAHSQRLANTSKKGYLITLFANILLKYVLNSSINRK